MSSMHTLPLANRVVLVLGGSSGIGLATASHAAAAGAAVALVARDSTRLTRAAAVVQSARASTSSGQITLHPADVTNETALVAALHDVVQQHGGVDHVLIAAGTATLAPLLDARPLHDQVAPLEQRIRTAVTVVRHLAPQLRSGGSFVFVGGLSTSRPVRGAWATSVGTAAVEQFARALALEVAPLRANAISPGWVDTPMWDGVLGAAKQDVFADVITRTPTGRFATADEVATAVLLLMQNGGITGEVLHIDAGQRLT